MSKDLLKSTLISSQCHHQIVQPLIVMNLHSCFFTIKPLGFKPSHIPKQVENQWCVCMSVCKCVSVCVCMCRCVCAALSIHVCACVRILTHSCVCVSDKEFKLYMQQIPFFRSAFLAAFLLSIARLTYLRFTPFGLFTLAMYFYGRTLLF